MAIGEYVAPFFLCLVNYFHFNWATCFLWLLYFKDLPVVCSGCRLHTNCCPHILHGSERKSSEVRLPVPSHQEIAFRISSFLQRVASPRMNCIPFGVILTSSSTHLDDEVILRIKSFELILRFDLYRGWILIEIKCVLWTIFYCSLENQLILSNCSREWIHSSSELILRSNFKKRVYYMV